MDVAFPTGVVKDPTARGAEAFNSVCRKIANFTTPRGRPRFMFYCKRLSSGAHVLDHKCACHIFTHRTQAIHLRLTMEQACFRPPGAGRFHTQWLETDSSTSIAGVLGKQKKPRFRRDTGKAASHQSPSSTGHKLWLSGEIAGFTKSVSSTPSQMLYPDSPKQCFFDNWGQNQQRAHCARTWTGRTSPITFFLTEAPYQPPKKQQSTTGISTVFPDSSLPAVCLLIMGNGPHQWTPKQKTPESVGFPHSTKQFSHVQGASRKSFWQKSRRHRPCSLLLSGRGSISHHLGLRVLSNAAIKEGGECQKTVCIQKGPIS